LPGTILFVLNVDARGKSWDSRLIIENYKRIRVSIEDISVDGKKIYRAKKTVKSWIESLLQHHGLMPKNDSTLEGVSSIQGQILTDRGLTL